MKMGELKEKIFFYIDKVRGYLSGYFVAKSSDNDEVRKKHKRVGWAIFASIGGLIIVALFLSIAIDRGVFARQQSRDIEITDNASTKVDIKNLKDGASHQETWVEKSEKDILDLKLQQKQATEKQDKTFEHLKKESVSKKELGHILKEFEKEMTKKFDERLKAQNQVISNGVLPQPQGNPIEVTNNKKKVIKKIGEYVPAGSYVEAKMILGVDAGVGIAAEANPRQVLLRVVGKTISAGFGRHYLTTKNLMGCTVQCQVVGDLSSEKAYLKPVLMTCAKSKDTVIELPVKGYVASKGKVGIRGEMIERNADLLAKTFVAGFIGAGGSAVSQALEPGFALSGGFAVKESGIDTAKNILGSGVGKGIFTSSKTLSDYLMKRAEQYQPIVSIDEGVSVTLVFQEGFSLKEEENNA